MSNLDDREAAFAAIADRAEELIQIATNGREPDEALHHLAMLAAKFEQEARAK